MEMATCPSGSERGHENVEVGRHGDVFSMLIVDFHHLFITDGDVTDVHGVGIQVTV